MVHFPHNPPRFRDQIKKGGLPFFRTLCDSASTLRETTLELDKVNCPICVHQLRAMAEEIAKQEVEEEDAVPPVLPIRHGNDDGPEIDFSDFDEVQAQLDGDSPAVSQRSNAWSRTNVSATRVVPYRPPSNEVLLSRMMLEPGSDPSGSVGFGTPDVRSALLGSERVPLAGLLSLIAGFGMADRALPILHALHRLCWSVTNKEATVQPDTIEDETRVEPALDLAGPEPGEDPSEE